MPIARKTYSDEEKEFVRNIGFKIQFFRKKAGYSQYQLAEKAELSETTIGHLESQADYGLSVVALFRIAKALNVGPDQMLKFD